MLELWSGKMGWEVHKIVPRPCLETVSLQSQCGPLATLGLTFQCNWGRLESNNISRLIIKFIGQLSQFLISLDRHQKVSICRTLEFSERLD